MVSVSISGNCTSTVTLFGIETWILSNQQRKMLESFHWRCVRFLTGDFITKLRNGDWHYPKTEDVMQKAGLKSIKQYIEQRRTNVEEYMTMESESIRIGVRKDSDI